MICEHWHPNFVLRCIYVRSPCLSICLDDFMLVLNPFLTVLVGSVKDSVVGEERIAQYLLAVLNCRSTPLHWRHINTRGLEENNSNDKNEYNVKDLLRNRRKPPNLSDVHYIEVSTDLIIILIREVKRSCYEMIKF